MQVALKPDIALKSKLFYGFSDSSRLSILESLRDGPLNVSEIVQRTALTQSNVSNHLSCLRDCGLVTRKQQGRFVLYQISDPRVYTLLTLADDVLNDIAVEVECCPRYTVPTEQHHE